MTSCLLFLIKSNLCLFLLFFQVYVNNHKVIDPILAQVKENVDMVKEKVSAFLPKKAVATEAKKEEWTTHIE